MEKKTSNLRTKSSILKDYLNPKVLKSSLLGFSSGLSVLLIMSTVPIWLNDHAISKTVIGLFALAYLPYVFKFVWAPFLNVIRLPYLADKIGHYRSWGLFTQVMQIIFVFCLTAINPNDHMVLSIICVVAFALFSAIRDIATDALKVIILGTELNAAGTGLYLLGFRIGMVVSGAGGLFLADIMPWSSVFTVLGLTLFIGLFNMLIISEPADIDPKYLYLNINKDISPWKIFRQKLSMAIKGPASEFFQRPNWALILLLIPFFKFSDNLIQSMSNIFFLEIGFSKTDIAQVAKIFGLAASIFGSLYGSSWVKKFGPLKTMFLCGIVHMLADLTFVGQALLGKHFLWFYFTLFITSFTSGMMTSGFVAYLAALCHKRFTSTQYALFSSLRHMDKCMAGPGGWLADKIPWSSYFLVSTLAALPGIALIALLMRKERKEEDVRPSTASPVSVPVAPIKASS